jgi:ATP-dependent Clp protease adapter protein ClpS
MGKVLNKANGMTIKTSRVTTFNEVTNFTDFLEVFLNKFFRFTRDIAQA